MFAVLLTLAGAFFIYVNQDSTTTVIVSIVVIVLAWIGHFAWVDQCKAENNWRIYWSSSGKDRAMMRHKWEAEAREEEALRRKRSAAAYEKEQIKRGFTKVDGKWTAGNVKHGNSTYPCPVCSSVMDEEHRVEYSSGTVYVTYKCGKCGKKLPVKIK